MSQARLIRPNSSRPTEEFGLTKQEQLFDRVSNERLLAFLGDEATVVHRVEENSNTYGEFMFVVLSSSADQGKNGAYG